MSIFQQMKDTLSQLCASLVGGFAHYVLLALLESALFLVEDFPAQGLV